ncbi:SURF1 family protein [Cognatishimia sp. MH4019]|uniref:SURF1 family protein n=1 Tax=Cognatishimia sp. MH4019 TaxID=2854030 RepID=UPI001CD71D24|nr:SURF1 family protein [Cognatishimia sp. MH4019]
MTARLIFPLLLGFIGAAILVSLGVWQMQRLEWKQGVLAEIDAQISGPAIALPIDADPEADRYAPVELTGTIGRPEIPVLVSVKRVGPGYRLIVPFETQGRRVLLDQGFIPLDAKDAARPTGEVTIRGNLHWPDEIDSYTPDNDLDANIWFSRDVPTLAEALDTEPLLVIAATQTDPSVTPLPVDSSAIPNDHLNYAITWFSLAVVWLGMTAFLVSRIRRTTTKG